MTLQDLRNFFDDGTEFELYMYGVGSFKMTNLLWGNAALAMMQIQPLRLRAEKNKVAINMTYDMPMQVFLAWKEYAEWEE